MVLALLAVIWVAVLAPPLLRRGAESRRSDSVRDFRRHLGVLQRAAPGMIAPAHTRRGGSHYAPALHGYAFAPPRAPGRSGPARPRVNLGRSRTLRRRRNVLGVLAGATVLLLVLGVIPSLHVMLAGAAVFAVLLMAYVAMLVRIRNLAAERDMKLTFLPNAAAPAGRADSGLLLRRSAT